MPPKICPDDKELNPKTNRCVKKCKSNRVRDLKTFKCIKNPLNHVINPITERYVKSAYLKKIEKKQLHILQTLKNPHKSPSHISPSHKSLSHKSLSHRSPSHRSPSHISPSHRSPSHRSPSHISPSHRSPSHISPSHISPSHISQSHRSQSHRSPSHKSLSHRSLSHRSPSHRSPSHISPLLATHATSIRQSSLSKSTSGNKISINSSNSNSSKKPSYNSKSRVFTIDIYKVKKIQGFLRDKLGVNKYTLINRINRYNLLKERLSLLKDNDCLEKKTFNGFDGYTIKNIINLEKKIGSKSKYGAIYLTSIPNFLGIFPIATKVMKYDDDNVNEINIMAKITNDILLKRLSRHFLMIYKSCICAKRIAARLKLISINELADGDLKMLVNKTEILVDKELLFNLIFQTYISIATFHNVAGYVHGDSHFGNYLYQLNNEIGYYHYICDGKDYYLKSCKYNIIIFDYGFATKINTNMKNKNIVKEESKNLSEDYTKIIYAFMNKKTGWGFYPNLPIKHINDQILEIHNIIDNNIKLELSSTSTNKIPYSKRIINYIIKEIFLKYTPKDMFITNRPSNVINEVPYRID